MPRRAVLAILTCVIVGTTAADVALAQPPGGRGRGGPVEPPGPPAPVPPEVAMPRPTADEVARMNAALTRFIDTSPDRPLLQKYQSLLTVQVPRDNPCIRPAPSARARRHEAFVNTAKAGDFDILFYGDSITDW